MGTVHAPGSARPYPRGFAKAWAVDHEGLAGFLAVNSRWGDDRGRVGLAILTMVGFTGLDRWAAPVDLSVYRLPQGVRARTPTWRWWFALLKDRLPGSARFPAAARREVIRAYAGMATTAGGHGDAVTAFEQVTGCSRAEVLAGRRLSRAIGCSTAFVQTMKALGPSPCDGGTTRQCLKRFARDYAGPRDGASLRAVLMQCQDAGILFTGTGRTYTTYANPLRCGSAAQQGVPGRYTEREHVVPNIPFARMPESASITLSLSPADDRAFLARGYCPQARTSAGRS